MAAGHDKSAAGTQGGYCGIKKNRAKEAKIELQRTEKRRKSQSRGSHMMQELYRIDGKGDKNQMMVSGMI